MTMHTGETAQMAIERLEAENTKLRDYGASVGADLLDARNKAKALEIQLSEARESCVKIAQEWRITDPKNTIGPIWVSGWNEACHKIAESIQGRDDRVKRNHESALNPEMTPMERILMDAVNEFCSCGGAGPQDGCTACKIWHRHVERSRKV